MILIITNNHSHLYSFSKITKMLVRLLTVLCVCLRGYWGICGVFAGCLLGCLLYWISVDDVCCLCIPRVLSLSPPDFYSSLHRG